MDNQEEYSGPQHHFEQVEPDSDIQSLHSYNNLDNNEIYLAQ
jgi:hypothetical protein